ncbi:NAD-dependent epimerase/dehydratase family protein [Microvirga roseola]|uniref:NAD-dependent epimerase/dehydratase family protein n=1 Tax=Microvirga roseola TaxID=2883126 RepID=UPI001E54C127|nr:NAD-dependent epimerase/dehydratase family protein [Microvirga roseola]
MARKAFIIGGTGQIGCAIAANLLENGWRVTASHRGHRAPPSELIERGLEVVTLDRQDSAAIASALGSGADALIDTVAFDETHARQLLEVETSVGTLLVISSASVYRDEAGRTLEESMQTGFPEFDELITERQATVDPGPGTYSTRKMALETTLQEQAGCPVTVLRPCAIHGPGSQHPREWWFVKRMLDGRDSIPLAYQGRSRFHTSSVRNIAELTRICLDNPGSRTLNIGDPDPPDVAAIGQAIARYMNYQGKFIRISDDDAYPPRVGTTPWSCPRPFLIDMAAASEIGYRPVATYEDSVLETCRWLSEVAKTAPWRELFPVLAGYPRDLFDYAAEDDFLNCNNNLTVSVRTQS